MGKRNSNAYAYAYVYAKLSPRVLAHIRLGVLWGEWLKNKERRGLGHPVLDGVQFGHLGFGNCRNSNTLLVPYALKEG